MVHRTERSMEKYKPQHLLFYICFPRRAGHTVLKETKRKIFMLGWAWTECFKVKTWSCSGHVGGGCCVTSNWADSGLKSRDSGSRLLTSLSAAVKPAQMPSICLCLGVRLASQVPSVAYPGSQLTRSSPQVADQRHLASPADLCHRKASHHMRSRKTKYCV